MNFQKVISLYCRYVDENLQGGKNVWNYKMFRFLLMGRGCNVPVVTKRKCSVESSGHKSVLTGSSEHVWIPPGVGQKVGLSVQPVPVQTT